MKRLVWTLDGIIQRVSPVDTDPDFRSVPSGSTGAVIDTEPGQELGQGVVWRSVSSGKLVNIGVLTGEAEREVIQSVETLVVLPYGGIGVA
jgi:hypothetical protein